MRVGAPFSRRRLTRNCLQGIPRMNRGGRMGDEESKNIRRTSAVLRRFSKWPTQGYDLEMAKQAGL